MLKRLELIGFKSFAETTVFDFAAGITAIVGPNGSGKSNIVDAVRWVLGEQSAKSLRGGAMADVIFNGSTSRRPSAHAEVTLTFDNSSRQLATDAVEVRIGRRVYRDGQSDYLINGQVCRLKDVRDLFLGTGAGAGAYCIIEQGRVDAVLQSSQLERRSIFEEAAGVSRFNAKKSECLRRLERVGQNLDRLNDILGEVEGQLRSVRNQASKAQKYRESSNRLRDLRVELGRRDYVRLSTELKLIEQEIAEIRQQADATTGKANLWTGQIQAFDDQLAGIETEIRADIQTANDLQNQATAIEAAIQRDREIIELLDASLRHDAGQAEELTNRCAALSAELSDLTRECALAESAVRLDQASVDRLSETLTALQLQEDGLTDAARLAHEERAEWLQVAAQSRNEAIAALARIENFDRQRELMIERSQQSSGVLATVDNELESLSRDEMKLDDQCSQIRHEVDQCSAQRDHWLEKIEQGRHDVTERRAALASLNSRIEVLEEIERNRDGLSAGIGEVLDVLSDPNQTSGLTAAVVGWLPDCLLVAHENAGLIDAALGPLAQSFIVSDGEALFAYLEQRSEALSGRAAFIPYRRLTAEALPVPAAMAQFPRADSLVACDRLGLADLPQRLLGTTFIVPDLLTARTVAAHARGYRFVTRAGELLDSDGTLTVGHQAAGVGVISQKSELRELRQMALELADHVDVLEFEVDCSVEQAGHVTQQLEDLNNRSDALSQQRAELRHRIGRHHDRILSLQEAANASQLEVDEIDRALADAHRLLKQHQAQAAKAEEAATAANRSAQQHELDCQATQRKRGEQQLAHTTAQVSLARGREQLASIKTRLEQVSQSLDERRHELNALSERMASNNSRRHEVNQNLTAATSNVLDCHSAIRSTTAHCENCKDRKAQLAAERDALLQLVGQDREMWQQCVNEIHTRELKATDIRHRRDVLSARLVEDYQLDLATTSEHHAQQQEFQFESDEQLRSEIDELRQKLSRLGAVNLESLEELTQIDLKASHLRTQHDDLTHARRTLDEIVQKIDVASHQLFIETFANVRDHFQELFRRLFGGGLADIVLTKPDEPLSSPIEIVARPPGKELRSIALMSGGERTLTAVALLLAIFQSKPSPFCLLDEVDAALDEANTTRLTHVLRQFADTSQFIVITHAKRTMTAADVLYGVTMQESGVSKRIAVRFDDWPSEQRRAA